MRPLIFFLVLVSISVIESARLLRTTDDIIENEYVVVYHSNTSALSRRSHLQSVDRHVLQKRKRHMETDSDQSGIFRLLHQFSLSTFHGYAAHISEDVLDFVLRSEHIDYVEHNKYMYMSGAVKAAFFESPMLKESATTTSSPTNTRTSTTTTATTSSGHSNTCVRQDDVVWNLHRISLQGPLNEIDPDFLYPAQSGQGVKVYVIDTGIATGHKEFGGRAVWGGNFVDTENRDCQGHGTHVAGVIAGERFGVAKKVTIVAVKVLSCDGRGSVATVLKGLEYVANTATKPSIVNLSLGGAYTVSLNSAVNNVVAMGFLTVVAAGNEDRDACTGSPSSATDAFTVGATSQSPDDSGSVDERSWFSNYGQCVHIFAPGTLIRSAWPTSNTASNTISGTSMAAPHVSGAAALYLATNPIATPENIKQYLVARATKDLIRLDCVNAVCAKSPNVLLYSGCS